MSKVTIAVVGKSYQECLDFAHNTGGYEFRECLWLTYQSQTIVSREFDAVIVLPGARQSKLAEMAYECLRGTAFDEEEPK